MQHTRLSGAVKSCLYCTARAISPEDIGSLRTLSLTPRQSVNITIHRTATEVAQARPSQC